MFLIKCAYTLLLHMMLSECCRPLNSLHGYWCKRASFGSLILQRQRFVKCVHGHSLSHPPELIPKKLQNNKYKRRQKIRQDIVQKI